MNNETMNTVQRSVTSRRSLMVSTASAAWIAVARPPKIVAAAEAAPEWIDAHVHVWSPDTTKYPISSDFKISDMQPPSFLPAELLSHSKPANVARIVLVQMSFYQYDHSFMIETMKSHPGVFAGVGIVDYRSQNLVERMRTLAGEGIRGFRLHSTGDAKDWNAAPGIHTLWKTCGEQGLAVCPLINPNEIQFVDRLCQKFPETTVVVDHFARIGINGTVETESLDRLCRLSRFPRTFVKTSAFYALGRKTSPYQDLLPMIKRVTGCFGADRLMWGSDCPYQVQDDHSYESSIALIRDHADFLSPAEKQSILRDTAEQVFF